MLELPHDWPEPTFRRRLLASLSTSTLRILARLSRACGLDARDAKNEIIRRECDEDETEVSDG